jgi:Domain of unknown function (DUF4124)
MNRSRWCRSRACLLGALAVLAAPAHAIGADVYKTVDASGNVVYSDHPSSPKSQKMTLPVQQADPSEAARLAKQHALQDADYAQRSRQEADEQGRQEAQSRQDAARCTSARNRYFSLRDVRRIFHLDADGNRVFYSDEEADAMRAAAKQEMELACGK